MPDYRAFVPRQRFQPVVAISPDGTQVAYSSNASGQFNLWVQQVSGPPPRQLTTFTDRIVRRFTWTPNGTGLYFTADRDGDEQYQIYRVGLDGGAVEQVTVAENCQHELADHPLSVDGRFLVYGVNDRDPQVQDVVVRDLRTGEETRIISPPEMIFWPVGISPDGRWLLTSGFRSSTDIDCMLIDLAQPQAPPVCVLKGSEEEFFEPIAWAADSQAFYLRTNDNSEFACAARYSLGEAIVEHVAEADWDVEHLRVSADGNVEMRSVNQAGCSVLHARRQGKPITLPGPPPGVITALSLSHDGSAIGLQIDAATRPADLGVLNLNSGTFDFLTDSRPPGLHTIKPVRKPSATQRSRESPPGRRSTWSGPPWSMAASRPRTHSPSYRRWPTPVGTSGSRARSRTSNIDHTADFGVR